MKKWSLCVLLLGCGSLWTFPDTGDRPLELPRDLQMQEQLVLLSAKVRKMTEIQDLIVQQQQLLLKHLNALEAQAQVFQAQGTSIVRTAEFSRWTERLEHLERQVQALGETNLQNTCAFLHDFLPVAKGTMATPVTPLPKNLEAYEVQPGDTLLRILARVNDLREQQHAPRITQDQVEKANPGLTPDRIRAGQLIRMPENP